MKHFKFFILYVSDILAALYILFSERVVNIWNSLPADTDLSSLACFIQHINSLEFR